MTEEYPARAEVKADAALKLAMAALELVHNLALGLGRPGVDFVDAARGLLDAEAVDQLGTEAFLVERASRDYAARIMTMLADDLDHR